MITLKSLITELRSPYEPAKPTDKQRGFIGTEHYGVIYAYDEMVPNLLRVGHDEFGNAMWGHRWRFFVETPKNTVVWNGDDFPPEKEVEQRVEDWLTKKGMKVDQHISPREYYYLIANKAERIQESAATDKIEVPKEPGSVPIPPNHLRLYHYTYTDPEIIKREGLKLSSAKGSTYGEPNVVWASLQQPQDNKTFVEFSMAIDDPRFTSMGSKPDVNAGVAFYKGRHTDFTILGDVNPSEFIAVHEPWHHTYRYLLDDDYIQRVLQGEFDNLISNERHPNESKAIMAIKHNFGDKAV